MAKFVFRLAAVLRQRELAERDAQGAMASVQRERLACEDRIARLQRMFHIEREAARGLVNAGGVSAEAICRQSMASQAIGSRIEREAVMLSGIAARQEQFRRKLAEAAMRRRAMELLRDRDHDAWRREQARAESRQVDDMVTARAALADASEGDA